MSSTNLRLPEKEQACHQEHERVHIGDYSPTELVANVEEDKVLHGTTSMQEGDRRSHYALFVRDEKN
jgi:hypothetical protein